MACASPLYFWIINNGSWLRKENGTGWISMGNWSQCGLIVSCSFLSVGDKWRKIPFWLINKMANYIFTFRIHLFFIAFVDLSYVSQRGKNRKNEISSVSRTRRQFHDSSYSKWPRLFFTIHLKTVQFPWLRTTTRAVRSNERGVRRWKDTTGTENLIKSLYEAE